MGLDTNRVLRVGVVYRGQILAERVLEKRSDVSVGLRPDSTVQISAQDHPDFPASIPVALIHKGSYYVVLPKDPNAQVNLRGGPSGSQGITAKDVVEIRGQRCASIDGFTGGSLALPDVIVMFQFVRSDAVPTVTHEQVVLRIGLVHEQRLLSDRMYEAGQKVSIGTSTKDTIVLPDIEYAGPTAVFDARNGNNVRCSLPVNGKLRVAVGGTPLDQADLIKKGLARQSGETVELKLQMKSRGRVSLGPYTLLFQVLRRTVTVPVMPRKSVFGQMISPLVADPVWSMSFMLSFLLLGAFVGQAVIFQRTTGKYLGRQRLEEQISIGTYEVLIEERTEPEPEKVQDVKSEKAKEEEAKELKDTTKKPAKVEKPQSTGKTIDPEEKRRNARAQAMKKTIAGAFGGTASTKMFGAAGEGEEGDVIAKTFGGAGGADGDDPSANAGLNIANGGGGTVERVKTGKIKGFGDREKTVVQNVQKVEKKINISLDASGLEGGGSDKQGVARIISRKNSAIQRCYENALRANPGLSGKVTVRFVVGTAGTVTTVTVLGASGGFASCIQGKFKAIRGLPLLPSPQSFVQSYVFTKS